MSRHPTDQISVVTNEGKLYQIGISDTTSIKDIRAAVADKMGTSTDKVRLTTSGCMYAVAVAYSELFGRLCHTAA